MSVGVRTADGIAEVVIDFPPVNALPVQGWRDLAAAVAAAGAEPATRAVILAAEGRGFCAGVDIKEMQRTAGARGADRRQPGLLRRVRRRLRLPGAGDRRGARLLPRRRRRPGRQRGHRGRGRRRDVRAARGRPRRAGRGHAPGPAGAAAADAGHGLHVPDRHRAAAAEPSAPCSRWCRRASCAPPHEPWPPRSRPRTRRVIRLAKQSLNGIDPVDVKRSYRYEQGFTFELNLAGAGDRARQAFVDGPVRMSGA